MFALQWFKILQLVIELKEEGLVFQLGLVEYVLGNAED